MARQKARREHFYQGNDGLATNETSWGNANRLLGANSAKANMNLQKIPGDYNAKKSKHAQ
jgi:hypothetical protein